MGWTDAGGAGVSRGPQRRTGKGGVRLPAPLSRGHFSLHSVLSGVPSKPLSLRRDSGESEAAERMRNPRDELSRLLRPQPCSSAGDNMDVCKEAAEPITLPGHCCFSFK